MIHKSFHHLLCDLQVCFGLLVIYNVPCCGNAVGVCYQLCCTSVRLPPVCSSIPWLLGAICDQSLLVVVLISPSMFLVMTEIFLCLYGISLGGLCCFCSMYCCRKNPGSGMTMNLFCTSCGYYSIWFQVSIG